MKKKDQNKQTNLILEEKVKIQRQKKKKKIFRVTQDDLVSTKHKQNVKIKIIKKPIKNVEIKSYHIQ